MGCGCHSMLLQKKHKINDKIPSTRHDKILKHVPIQKWYTKQPKQSGNHTRLPKSRVQQDKDHIWSILTSIYRLH